MGRQFRRARFVGPGRPLACFTRFARRRGGGLRGKTEARLAAADKFQIDLGQQRRIEQGTM